MDKRVYIFGHTTAFAESTIGFATMLLNIPYVLPCDINIDLNTDVLTAFNNFLKSSFNIFVCMPTTMSGLDFVRKAIEHTDHACIFGRYVIPKIDWEEFQKGGKLIEYNYDLKGDWPAIPLPIKKLPETFVVHKEKLPSKEPLETVQDLLNLFNSCGPVLETSTTISVFGKNVFKGAVGLRSIVR